MPPGVVHIADAAVVVSTDPEGIEQEKVDRIRPGSVVTRIDPEARAEGVAEHAADIVGVSSQSVCESAGLNSVA